jgi:hypothetical protein
MTVFWVVAPCSLVEVYQSFRGPFCLHHQGDASFIYNLPNIAVSVSVLAARIPVRESTVLTGFHGIPQYLVANVFPRCTFLHSFRLCTHNGIVIDQFMKNVKRRGHLEEVVLDRMIILKWILRKQYGSVWTVFICLRIGTNGEL